MSTGQLLLTGLIGVGIYRCRRKAEGPWLGHHAAWVILAVLFCYLALDEKFTIHELADQWIHQATGITETALTDRLDDALIGLVGLLILGIIYGYRSEFVRFIRFKPIFIATSFIALASVTLDALSNRSEIFNLLFETHRNAQFAKGVTGLVEDILKLISGALVLILSILCYRQAATDVNTTKVHTSASSKMTDQSEREAKL